MLYNWMRLESHTGQLLNWLSYFVLFLNHNQATPTTISPLVHDRFLPHSSQLTFYKWGDFWHCIVIIWYIDPIVMHTVKNCVMWPLCENFRHPVPCAITGFRREVAENFALLSYYAANSRIITRRVIILKIVVLRLYNACTSISPLCRYYQWHQYKTLDTRNNPEGKVKGKYIKHISLSVYCKWVSNNWYFPQNVSSTAPYNGSVSATLGS
jgi:hypothetical protein